MIKEILSVCFEVASLRRPLSILGIFVEKLIKYANITLAHTPPPSPQNKAPQTSSESV